MRSLAVAVVLAGSAGTASAAKPLVTFGAPAVTGAVDANAVEQVVKRSASKLLACYKQGLARTPNLRGTATATFTITADGGVTDAAATGVTDAVDACIASELSKLRFAKPRDGKPVEVSYPVVCDPGDTVAIGTIGVGRIGRIGGTGTGTGTGVGFGSGRGRIIGSIGQSTGAGDKDVIQRTIQRNARKVRACYERALHADPSLEGKVVVQFHVGVDGRVMRSTASGMPAIDVCVASAVQSMVFPRLSGETNVSYPFLFHAAK